MARIDRGISGAILTAVLAAASPGAVLAQDEASCAKIATAAERLACYDRLLPPAPAEPATAGSIGAPPKAVAGETANDALVAPGSASPAAAESERSQALPVVVVGMRKYPGRSATFTTETGEVWVQIGAEGVYLPKVPFKAELRPASMGTYFLRPADYGWRVHVRRDD